MSVYIRDIILIILYGFFVISQLTFSSYLIHNKDNLENILFNYKNIRECKNSAIYRLNNGSLINNSFSIMISSSIIIGSFILIMINKIINKFILNKYEYESLNDFDTNKNINNIISGNLIPREKYDMTIQIIFIMGIICFIVCNGIQFVLQLNNIDESCLHYIDNKLDNFYVIYKFMTTVAFFSSYALFFIVPCFL